MNKIFWLVIERYLYTARTTIGRLKFIYGTTTETFCYTLEDTQRPHNIKVYGETGLPGGLECFVGLFENDHYKQTIIFYTEPDKETILVPPLKWVGCLAHNGVDYKDTEGCVLCGKYLLAVTADHPEPQLSWGMKEALRARVDQAIKDGYTIKARFVNLDQLQ